MEPTAFVMKDEAIEARVALNELIVIGGSRRRQGLFFPIPGATRGAECDILFTLLTHFGICIKPITKKARMVPGLGMGILLKFSGIPLPASGCEHDDYLMMAFAKGTTNSVGKPIRLRLSASNHHINSLCEHCVPPQQDLFARVKDAWKQERALTAAGSRGGWCAVTTHRPENGNERSSAVVPVSSWTSNNEPGAGGPAVTGPMASSSPTNAGKLTMIMPSPGTPWESASWLSVEDRAHGTIVFTFYIPKTTGLDSCTVSRLDVLPRRVNEPQCGPGEQPDFIACLQQANEKETKQRCAQCRMNSPPKEELKDDKEKMTDAELLEFNKVEAYKPSERYTWPEPTKAVKVSPCGPTDPVEAQKFVKLDIVLSVDTLIEQFKTALEGRSKNTTLGEGGIPITFELDLYLTSGLQFKLFTVPARISEHPGGHSSKKRKAEEVSGGAAGPARPSKQDRQASSGPSPSLPGAAKAPAVPQSSPAPTSVAGAGKAKAAPQPSKGLVPLPETGADRAPQTTSKDGPDVPPGGIPELNEAVAAQAAAAQAAAAQAAAAQATSEPYVNLPLEQQAGVDNYDDDFGPYGSMGLRLQAALNHGSSSGHYNDATGINTTM